ncbi:hypothetical protein PHISP_04859 [Aspergillus sp. HF37]|nr:hypothetical protein PHISP_04859 [Aspergillus sp. HF37]
MKSMLALLSGGGGGGGASVPSTPTTSMETKTPWAPYSWASKETIAHAVEYEDSRALHDVISTIERLPPLVSPIKVEVARTYFAAAARGKAFIIQAGDCAENFDDVRQEIIQQKVELLQEQSALLTRGLDLSVVTVGRIAGQYAKPRSCAWEALPDGPKTHAFFGHNVNSPDVRDRSPDPRRLLLGYLYSRATLDLIKDGQALTAPAATDSAATTPPTPGSWNLIPAESKAVPFESPAGVILTSHEALHLPYETAMTRDCYNTSASFIWLGERTRQLDGAHVEYVRGLRNPIGVKIGPGADAGSIVELLNTLCPQPQLDENTGRVTLITRLGADQVAAELPQLITAVRAAGHAPVWMCDPCHGNTQCAAPGVKTRHADRMLLELVRTFQVHRENGSVLGGLHLEQTGEAVTECVDNTEAAGLDSLPANYRTLCDPRLSRVQAVTLVRRFVDFVRAYDGKQMLVL